MLKCASMMRILDGRYRFMWGQISTITPKNCPDGYIYVHGDFAEHLDDK